MDVGRVFYILLFTLKVLVSGLFALTIVGLVVELKRRVVHRDKYLSYYFTTGLMIVALLLIWV